MKIPTLSAPQNDRLEPYFCERYKYQCLYFNWLQSYKLKRKFMIFSPFANLMHHPLFSICGGLNIATFYSLFAISLIFYLISLECIKNYFTPLSILQMLPSDSNVDCFLGTIYIRPDLHRNLSTEK